MSESGFKKFEKKMTKEMIESSKEIYLPNRYQQPFIDALQQYADIEVPAQVGRRLAERSNGRTFRWMRGRDIPRVIARINATRPDTNAVGFTGSDWCQEYIVDRTNATVDWYALYSAPRMGRLAIIAPPSLDGKKIEEQLYKGDPVSVVTVYPNIANIFVPKLSPGFNTSSDLVVNGGVEGVADALGMPAIDLVSSGDTVRENGFTVVEKLQEVFPAMVTGERQAK